MQAACRKALESNLSFAQAEIKALFQVEINMKTAVLLSMSTCLAFSSPLYAEEKHPVNFDDVEWQASSVEDMSMFEPYIGSFRGETFTADSGTEFFFSVTYEYYDRNRTVVKYTLQTHLPQTSEVRPLGEGFYMWDAFSSRIKVVGVFKDGRIGSGYMSPYDTQSGAREVRIHASNPDGSQTEVRDTFWLIDEDSWGNKTYISNGGEPWQAISEAVYTRLKS